MIAARLGTRGLVLAGVVTGLLILAVAWSVVISPVRSDAGQLRDETASVQTQNTVLQAQNNKLRDQAANKSQLVDALQSALSGLPSGAGLPVFSRQLATQATARGLSLNGVAIGTPVSPTAGTGDAAADPGAATADGTTAAPTTTAPTSSTPLAIPITITTDGPALQQLQFLRDVQQVGPRLALVTSTALVPTQAAGAAQSQSIDAGATMTLQLTVFTQPLPKATRQQLAQLTGGADANGDGDDADSRQS